MADGSVAVTILNRIGNRMVVPVAVTQSASVEKAESIEHTVLVR